MTDLNYWKDLYSRRGSGPTEEEAAYLNDNAIYGAYLAELERQESGSSPSVKQGKPPTTQQDLALNALSDEQAYNLYLQGAGVVTKSSAEAAAGRPVNLSTPSEDDPAYAAYMRGVNGTAGTEATQQRAARQRQWHEETVAGWREWGENRREQACALRNKQMGWEDGKW